LIKKDYLKSFRILPYYYWLYKFYFLINILYKYYVIYKSIPLGLLQILGRSKRVKPILLGHFLNVPYRYTPTGI